MDVRIVVISMITFAIILLSLLMRNAINEHQRQQPEATEFLSPANAPAGALKLRWHDSQLESAEPVEQLLDTTRTKPSDSNRTAAPVERTAQRVDLPRPSHSGQEATATSKVLPRPNRPEFPPPTTPAPQSPPDSHRQPQPSIPATVNPYFVPGEELEERGSGKPIETIPEITPTLPVPIHKIESHATESPAAAAPTPQIWPSEPASETMPPAEPDLPGLSPAAPVDKTPDRVESGSQIRLHDESPVRDPRKPATEPVVAPATPGPSSSVSIDRVPEVIAKRAQSHLKYGNSLARRGSVFAARQEFIQALKIIVESLDVGQGNNAHAMHFDAALIAISEAEDFYADGNSDSILLPLEQIIKRHQTQIISAEQAVGLTPISAMQLYYSYATTQLAQACGRDPVASELLFALGKLHTVMAAQNIGKQSINRAIAVTMHQSATLVDARNYQSANELGVALAELGHLEQAREILLQSLTSNPTPQAWQNLAIVHQQLGESHLSELALRERQILEQSAGEPIHVANQIKWVTPNEFGQYQTSSFDYPESMPANAPDTSAAPPANPEQQGTLWSKMKKWF